MRWLRVTTWWVSLLAWSCTKQSMDGNVAAANHSRIQQPGSRADTDDGHAQPPSQLGKLLVAAGALDRDHTIVTFPLNREAAGALGLRDADGRQIPLQLRGDGTATFVLESLEAGQEAAFTIERSETSTASAPDVVERRNTVELGLGAHPVVRFQKLGELPPGVDEVFRRGGYLHPVFTPAGVAVTGDYPEDHRHHHGIWSAWTRTRFKEHAIDFWNMAAKQGKVDFRALERTFRGPVFAGFTARLQHLDLLGEVPEAALDETWTVTNYQTHRSTPPYFVVDLDSTQRTLTEAPVLLEQYIYGGFAVRGRAEWGDPAQVTFSTSEGFDRGGGDDKKGRWCAVAGRVEGAEAGFAMLGHPENFRAPQTFRIHPDHPYMAFSPVKDGPFSIEPGQPYVSRFRILSFDGPADRKLIDRLWHDYATPPVVTVTSPELAVE